jgi:hypothetical protein
MARTGTSEEEEERQMKTTWLRISTGAIAMNYWYARSTRRPSRSSRGEDEEVFIVCIVAMVHDQSLLSLFICSLPSLLRVSEGLRRTKLGLNR